MGISNQERLAIFQAFYNAAGEHVSTKSPGNLRSQVDAEYRELYEQTGAKSFEQRVNGMRVGTYSVKVSKAKEAEMDVRFEVREPERLLEWVERQEHGDLVRFAKAHAAEYAQDALLRTGELADGCSTYEVGTPAMPEQYAGGSLRIDPQLVAEALGNQLPEAMNLLLEGGEDE